MNRKPSILKVNLDNDIRRVSLSATGFVELQKQIAELFSVEPGTFSLKYKDDEGDMISICSEEEYREAIVCCQTDILRINAIINKPKEETHQGKHPRCRGRGNWKKWCKRNNNSEQATPTENTNQQQPGFHNLLQFLGPLQGMASNLIQGGGLDHILGNLLNSDIVKLEHNHVCDGCDTQISGTRYHCTQCTDFDFCSTCFQEKLNTHFQDHKFEEISALQAFKQAMSNHENIEAFFAPGKSSDPVEKTTHRAFCDRCNQGIVGIRWKCLDCEDFDFCNSCYVAANGVETINSHLKTHVFGKIESPQDTESFLLQRKEHLSKQQEQEKERQEQERLEKLRQEQERILRLKQEHERILKEKQEQERIVREKLEKERLEKERLEKEKQNLNTNTNKIVYPFEKKLEDLASMGFEDRTTNIRLLIKNKGDVVATIQELIGN